MTQADKASERGGFVQYPCQLIYNCPVLNRDDKWVLLAIMGVCWTEGPYRLSYRDIAALSGVPISLLSSVAAKDGKPAKEGIMDRLKRLEYIRCVMGKEKDAATGKAKGNAQTYIYVNYTKIWAESISYKGDGYKVNEPVLNTNTPVSYTNRFVSNKNKPVPDTNEGVSYTNEPVRDSRSKVDTYITYITVDNLDKEDREDTTAVSDDTRTPSPSFAQGEDDATDTSHRIHYQHSGNNLDSVLPDSDLSGLTEDTRTVASTQPETTAQSTQQQIAKLNRLTNPVSPSTQEIVDADESPREIERETANDTPSSPVVNAATDEVIHTDTRNDADSYSPQSTARNTSETEPGTEQAETPANGKGSGKGKGSGRGGRKKSEPPTEDQFRKVFDTMNEVFRKLHPETPDFKVIETKKAREYVQTLIEAKGNPALLKLTMFDMWNEVDARGEHWWRKTGRMTVRAIIEQYTSRAPMLASKLPNHATAKSEAVKEALADNTASKPPIVVSSSPLGAYSSRPELQPWKDDGAVSDDALNRPSWAAIKKQRKQAAGGR